MTIGARKIGKRKLITKGKALNHEIVSLIFSGALVVGNRRNQSNKEEKE
ncbi:MAG: hypothetical protein UF030_00895 [Eggerthellaceae bacterium]|nr:hypothetical protein [Eggerthellaceae bacterium]